MIFGLATEGITDQAVLENILYGVYKSKVGDDIEDEIAFLQPAFDETTRKQEGYGSWTGLIAYLGDSRFREDVINNNFVIIQIDTDVVESLDDSLSRFDDQGNVLNTHDLIDLVQKYLISEIDNGKEGFYSQNSSRIIFCLTVDSIECWLIAHHHKESKHKCRTQNCEEHLVKTIKRFDILRNDQFIKNYDCYNTLSKDFRKIKNIQSAVLHNESLKAFLEKLPDDLS